MSALGLGASWNITASGSLRPSGKRGKFTLLPMLTISKVTKAFGGRTLFEQASLQVNRGDRIGLVGPNGAGKSTLFSLVLGEATPDEGRVSLERSATLGFLPQENAPAGDETVIEMACAVSPELAAAQRILKGT